jgi:hypothetical protein
MVNLYFKEQHEEPLKKLCEITTTPYRYDILKGLLEKPGFMGKVGREFVVGKVKRWAMPESSNEGYYFVRINNSSAYPRGLILTPYSDIDVRFHLKTKKVDETTPYEREELLGTSNEDFVVRAIMTYHDSIIRKWNEKDGRFVLQSRFDF